MWTHIQDVIGSANLWPKPIRRFFWAKRLNQWERVRVASFLWINGLNPETFYDWCDVRKRMTRGSREHRHFQELFRLIDAGHRRNRWWGWNVVNSRYEYLNGKPRSRDD